MLSPVGDPLSHPDPSAGPTPRDSPAPACMPCDPRRDPRWSPSPTPSAEGTPDHPRGVPNMLGDPNLFLGVTTPGQGPQAMNVSPRGLQVPPSTLRDFRSPRCDPRGLPERLCAPREGNAVPSATANPTKGSCPLGVSCSRSSGPLRGHHAEGHSPCRRPECRESTHRFEARARCKSPTNQNLALV